MKKVLTLALAILVQVSQVNSFKILQGMVQEDASEPQVAAATNQKPGINFFMTRKVSQNLIDKHWKQLEKGINQLTIPGKFPETGPVQFENLHIMPETKKPDLSKLFNSANNSMDLTANNVTFQATGTILIPKFINTGGVCEIKSTLTNVKLTTKFDKTQKDQGDIPMLTFSDAAAQVDPHIQLSSKAFIFKDVLTMVNDNWFGLRDRVSNEINKVLSKPASYTDFNKFLNDALMQGYPTSVQIPNQSIRVSTYTSGGIQIKDKGIYLPLEGFFYDTTAGYDGTYQCGDLPAVIDYTDETHDAVLVVGDCAANSLLVSLAKSGKSISIPE